MGGRAQGEGRGTRERRGFPPPSRPVTHVSTSWLVGKKPRSSPAPLVGSSSVLMTLSALLSSDDAAFSLESECSSSDARSAAGMPPSSSDDSDSGAFCRCALRRLQADKFLVPPPAVVPPPRLASGLRRALLTRLRWGGRGVRGSGVTGPGGPSTGRPATTTVFAGRVSAWLSRGEPVTGLGEALGERAVASGTLNCTSPPGVLVAR